MMAERRPRAVIVVMDSVGIGGAPDAHAYGDAGADTLGHIAHAASSGRADRDGLRSGQLRIAHLDAMGLGAACRLATGRTPAGLGQPAVTACYGAAEERSRGKDTPSGHWEIAGLPVDFDWGYFPRTQPCFPDDLVSAFCRRADVPGILGNRHASGTQIIAELGDAHIRTGMPICYTSADSVFQIAAHEAAFGLDRLHAVCAIARTLLDEAKIGRVIARPFIGTPEAGFRRTQNRRDYAVPPHAPTLFDRASDAGRDVVTVGKIADIFAHRGTGRVLKGGGDDALFDHLVTGVRTLGPGGLLMANFVEFDSEYGHRRDVAGYAAALERFDRRLPEVLGLLEPDDLFVITADHGCDPTAAGSDHTRERVPVLVRCAGFRGSVGVRSTFADIAATAARHLGLAAPLAGTPFARSQ